MRIYQSHLYMDINTKIFRDNFLQYYRPLCLFALHYLKNIDDAEDAVQDCFMELWKRKEKGFEVSGFKSYLYSMVRNRCIDILKKDSLIDGNVQPSDLEEILSDEECEEWSYVHIPADTRSAFPVISVQSPVSIQYCWQS